jgi:hypothetical protein
MVARLKIPAGWSPGSGALADGIAPLQARLIQFPDDLPIAYKLAILHLYLGQVSEHQVLARNLLAHVEQTMASTQLSDAAQHFVLICLLDKTVAREHAARLRPLLMHKNAEEPASDNASPTSHLNPWGLLSLGWAEFRLDDHEAAVATFNELTAEMLADPLLNALAQVGLAGTQLAAGKLPAAEQATAAARQHLDEYRRWRASQVSDVPRPWPDELICETVQREPGN